VNEAEPVRVLVEFHHSSTKGGGEGYRIVASSEATESDAEHACEVARRARDLVRAELGFDAPGEGCAACRAVHVLHVNAKASE